LPSRPEHNAHRSLASARRRLGRAALVVPAAVLFGISFVWPVFTIVLRSLNADGRARFGDGVYFGHYREVFANQLLRQVAIRTAQIALISTVATVLLAFPAAYLISRSSRRRATILMILIVTPFWISVLVRLFAFTVILGRRGLVNRAFDAIGLGPYSLLFNTRATVIGMVAFLVPYMILILAAAMAGIDRTLVTAAHTMGATPRQAFFQIYLPQLRPALVSGSMVIFVISLGFFLTPAILGGPQDATIPVFIQQQIDLFKWGRGSAAGILLLVISLVGYAVAIRAGGASVLGLGRRPTGGRGTAAELPQRPGLSVVLSWVVMAVVLLLLLLPLVVVIPAAFSDTTQLRFPPQGFTIRWFERVVGGDAWRSAFYKSLRVAALTAVVTTALGLSVARFGTTTRSSVLRGCLQVVVFAPLIVPVILLAIGIFDVQLTLGLIGSELGLVSAHAALCLPFVFLILANALAGTDASLEEAAWSMGVSRTRAFWTITMPAITPAVLSALLISFLASWDEAVVALFQVGLDKTLPVLFFSLLQSGVNPGVAAMAVLLMTPVLVGVAVWAVVSARRQTPAFVGPDAGGR
jgi:putative spermidine/putrescine transport system permease protein